MSRYGHAAELGCVPGWQLRAGSRKNHEGVVYVGWLGMTDHVLHALRTVGADRDAEDNFLIDGGVASFMRLGEEVCISDGAHYLVGGQPRSLAALMNSTSYGVRGVTVISAEADLVSAADEPPNAPANQRSSIRGTEPGAEQDRGPEAGS
jgi:hypothetical protein